MPGGADFISGFNFSPDSGPSLSSFFARFCWRRAFHPVLHVTFPTDFFLLFAAPRKRPILLAACCFFWIRILPSTSTAASVPAYVESATCDCGYDCGYRDYCFTTWPSEPHSPSLAPSDAVLPQPRSLPTSKFYSSLSTVSLRPLDSSPKRHRKHEAHSIKASIRDSTRLPNCNYRTPSYPRISTRSQQCLVELGVPRRCSASSSCCEFPPSEPSAAMAGCH